MGVQKIDDKHFRLLLDQVQDYAVYLMDLEGNKLTWNQGVKRVFGYDEKEWIGSNLAELFVPEEREAGLHIWELETAAKEGRATDDRWMLRKDGSRFWASGITTGVRDEDGELIALAKVVRDLTERERARLALEASEERLRIALEGARMGLWRKPFGEDRFQADESLLRLLDLSPRASLTTVAELAERMVPEDRERILAAFAEAEGTAEQLELEVRTDGPNGRVLWLAAFGRRMHPAPGQECLAGAFVDITDRKESESRLIEAQRMDAVGQLAGGVAHEINNMLTAVLGFTDLLLLGIEPGDPRRADLKQIHRAASRAASITGQLLAFGRRHVLKLELVNLNTTLRTLSPVLRHVLGEDKRLELDLAENLGCIRVDPGLLEQVVLNLALNARDALDPGGKLTLGTRNEEPRPELGLSPFASPQRERKEMRALTGGVVVLTAADTGRGMDDDTRARAFEPFFTTKPVGQGTGLGLSTVLGIVKQSGGAVHLESTPGRGTTFNLFFLEVDCEPAEAEAAAAVKRLVTHETVLVVEDDALVRAVTRRYLESAGYLCVEAANGAEALELLERDETVVLVLSDVVMPAMGGRELAEEVAAFRPELPVVLMTGHPLDDMDVADGPAATILRKPFTATDLLAKVREALDR